MNRIEAHHLPVTRTARYHTLGASAAEAEEVWFVLHGYGQLSAHFIRHFAAIDDGRRRFIAPEALSRCYLRLGEPRIGAVWMTREDRLHEIEDYVRYLDALYGQVFEEIDRDAVTVQVLGFSQGTATATRWLALGNARIDHLILWAGDVANDLDLDAHRDAFARARPVMVVGTEDQYITPERMAQEEARLKTHAIPYTLHTFEGDHRLDAETLRRLYP